MSRNLVSVEEEAWRKAALAVGRSQVDRVVDQGLRRVVVQVRGVRGDRLCRWTLMRH